MSASGALLRQTCFRALPNQNLRQLICRTSVTAQTAVCSSTCLLSFQFRRMLPGPICPRAGALLMLGASVLDLAAPAAAHEWYPAECCHAKDCAPVESWAFAQTVQALSLPQISATTKHGSAVVPQDLPRREWMDNRMHARMRASCGGAKRIVASLNMWRAGGSRTRKRSHRSVQCQPAYALSGRSFYERGAVAAVARRGRLECRSRRSSQPDLVKQIQAVARAAVRSSTQIRRAAHAP